MKMTKTRAAFLILVLCGIIFSSIMLAPRLAAEKGDKSVAAAVYYSDIQLLSAESGQGEDFWLELFAGTGVGYVIFDEYCDTSFISPYDLEPACLGSAGGDWAFRIPQGDEVLTDVPMALIENMERSSVLLPEGFSLEETEAEYIKALELYPSYADRGGEAIAELIQRACIDRGIRLVLLHPFTENGKIVTDPAEYGVLSGLSAELAKRGLDFGGKLQTFDARPLNSLLLWGSGLLTTALWVWLVCRWDKLKKFEFWLYITAAALLGLCCLVVPQGSQKLLMLACAAAFPTMAVYGAQKSLDLADRRSAIAAYLLGLCALGAWSILGGLAVSALMSSREYLLGYDIFSGVKLSQAVPLACCFVVFALPVYRNIRENGLSRKGLAWLAVVAAVLAAAAYLLMLRSGDLSGGISQLETSLRSALEQALYARPRTKEFLIAVPFAALLFTKSAQKYPLLALLGALACCLECVSVVNTFCHAVAPVGVSVIRSLLGLGIGAVFGLIVLCMEYLVRKIRI